MCGIAGFISKSGDEPVREREELLGRMCSAMIYRGPDEEGKVVMGRAALGMRRLSIIDISSGQQPIYNSDGNLAIVFNGEIYNFQELRKELEGLGHTFRTNSDTEVIINAYERFGPDCVAKLRGMFAFAIWNKKDESLFIARDRLGKKPLFYSITPGGKFLFGSELKTLLVHPDLPREVDTAAIDAYLSFGYVPEEFCILKDVEKLPPGHFLRFHDGKIEVKKYWDIDFSAIREVRKKADYIEMLREKIRETVRIRLISEVPLGAFLSGGVDSSSIVGMMAELSDKPVKTFSIGFKEDSFDELKYARIAAAHFKTEHHEFIVTPDLYSLIDDIVWHFDEPFADQSSLPVYMLSKLASEHVTVILSGDGGDEVFAGYSRYVTERQRMFFAKLPRAFREKVFRRLGEALPHGARGKNFLYNISLDPDSRYIDNISAFNGLRKRYLYSDGLLSGLNDSFGAGEKIFLEMMQRREAGAGIEKLLYLDSKTYLPADILTKVDRMTMANSIEARVPLLDHELVEMATLMPAELKMNGLETKYIFKKAMEGIVPNKILYRKKQGFGVPVGQWINTSFKDRIINDLTEKRALDRGYFDKVHIEQLLKEHSAGTRDHSTGLWMLWMLELWHRRFIDGDQQ